ncbi:AraC family transcriptional regulator [Nocardia tengchongensis]|uniref:AraC family transcriptional regulator n=1 Tax=Nocardia tengchongensis TaxID=2055889 RepID=UPI0033C243C5
MRVADWPEILCRWHDRPVKVRDVTVGGPAISTAGMSSEEGFDLWAAIMDESMVPCSVQPLPGNPFKAMIDPCAESESISIARFGVSGTFTRRDQRHIAKSDAQYVLAYLTIAGTFDIRFGQSYLRVPVGTMFVADSERPQEAIASDYEAIMVRIQRDLLLSSAGLSEDDFPHARRLQPIGHEALVVDYFQRMAQLPPDAMGSAPMLNTGIELLAAALALGTDRRPSESAASCHKRQQVIAYIKANLADPDLSLDRIAHACKLSRGQLYRLFARTDDGPMQLLRRLRVEKARKLLLGAPEQTIAAIAQACGFTGERNFYRVFRAETGLAPGEYRAPAG